ncbi:Cytochrome c oxidase subunit VIb, partial [Phytophthora palmivora]
MPAEAKLKTTPLDPRFPNQNQAQHCWTRYNEYVLCLKSNDGDEDACHKYFQYAASLCPSSW